MPSNAAVRLHQTGLSLRLHKLKMIELTICGQKRHFAAPAPMSAISIQRRFY